LSTHAVEAQRDGIHFVVDNRAKEPASINGFATDVSAGISKNVAAHVGPGTVKIACYPFSMHGQGKKAIPDGLPLEIRDPNDYWVDPELKCPDGTKFTESSILEYVQFAKSRFDDPIEATKDFFDDLNESDDVKLASYPGSEPPATIVTRGDLVLAEVSFIRAEDGGVLVEGYTSCAIKGLSGP
jgi:hypothetical protein